MQKLRFILSLVFLPTAMGLWAQDREMSLNDCLVYARDHAFANRSNHLAVEQTKMDKRIQAASMLPSIGFSTGGDLSFGRGVDPETNTYDTKKTFNNGYSLSMQLPLFDGLVSLNNYRAARMAELIQGKSAENDADQISLAVIKAYYNIMYYSALVEQMESQLASDRHNLAVTERQEQLGTKSGADVDEMKAMVASDEYELLNQQNLRRKAMIELKAQMGMPVNEELRIKNEESFGSKEVRVKSEESICAIDVSAGNSTLTKDSSFFISSQAHQLRSLHSSFKLHPRIMQAEYELRRSRYQLRAARGNFMPRISLSGGISTSYYKVLDSDYKAPSFSTQWHNNMGQYIGFSLSMPLFDGLANVNRLKRAKLNYRQQQVELDKTRYEIEREMNEALLDVNAAESEWHAAEARVEAEKQSNRAMQRKYELGGVSALDLYTSNSKLATARATLVGKRIQTIINKIIYEYYQGVPLIRE